MSKDEQKQDWRRKNRPYILAFLLAFIMTMFFKPEMVEGNSMKPTLEEKQVVVCKKTSYSENRGEPEIGKVVVLRKQFSKKIADDNIICRVVGLPGEKVEIKKGKLYRDGKEYSNKNLNGNMGKDLSIKLSKEEIYLLCDNMDLKIDSRNNKLGPVNMKEIEGNVVLSIWPVSKFGRVK